MSGFEGVKKFLDLCRTNIEEFEEEMRTASQLKLFNDTSDISSLKTNIRNFFEIFKMHHFYSKVSSWLGTARKEKSEVDKRDAKEQKRVSCVMGVFGLLSLLICANDSETSVLNARNIDGKNNEKIKELENEKKYLLSKILLCCNERVDLVIEGVRDLAYGFYLRCKISFYQKVKKPSGECPNLKECFSKFTFGAISETSRIKDDVSSKFDSFMWENETLIKDTRSFLSRHSNHSETESFLDSILPNLQEWLKSVYNFYYNTIEINVFNFMIAYHTEYINALTEERQRLLDCEVKIRAQISKLSVFLNECKVEEERLTKKYKELSISSQMLIVRFFVIKFTIKKLGICDPNSNFDSPYDPLGLNEREMREKIYFWPYICNIEYVITEIRKAFENEKKLADESFSSLEVSVEALKSSLILMEDKKASGIEAADKDFFSVPMVEFFRIKAECDLFFDKVKNIFYSIVYFEKVLIKLAVIAHDKLVMHNLLINKNNEEISSCSIKKKAIGDGVRTREGDVYVFEQIEQAYREASFGAFEEIDGRLSTLK